MSMDDLYRSNPGLVIEGFVASCLYVIYRQRIEVRNHPTASWAQATISQKLDNFGNTRGRLIEMAEGLSKKLDEEGDTTHAADVSVLISNLRDSQTPIEAGSHIRNAKPWLDKIFPAVDVESYVPNPSETL